jgi:hypothetical protein
MRNKQGKKKEVFKQAPKGSREFIEMQKKAMEKKRVVAEKKVVEESVPRFVSAMLFGCCVPQSFLLYKMIWADACSDTFFQAFDLSMMWIAACSALEGAAGVALGYIDYKIKHGNSQPMIYTLRKKRLAFSKFSFMMAVLAMTMVDQPSGNTVLPLLIGQVFSATKMAT